MSGKERTVVISVRLTPEEHRLLKEAAALDRRTLNSALAVGALRWAHEVLRAQQPQESPR